ncbi:MAG: LEPR-XLL domain-containing protein, partial [Candidatus Omnitrophica bacterium]|nr:LEPR-XLL domain-containing protein [Candidatus Omnitrophota bacterium]
MSTLLNVNLKVLRSFLGRIGELKKGHSISNRAFRRKSRFRNKTKQVMSRRMGIEPLEPRILLSGDVTVVATADADLLLRLDPNDSNSVQVVDVTTDDVILASESLDNLGGSTSGYAVKIDGTEHNVSLSLTIDDSILNLDALSTVGGVVFEAGTGEDTLIVSLEELLSFDEQDLSGSLHDGLILFSGVENLIDSNDSEDVANLSVVLSLGGDDAAIEEYSSDSSKLRLYRTDGGSSELIFNKPSESLEIHLGMGNDTLHVFDLGTIGYALTINGGYETDAGFIDGSDAVIFENTNAFNGNDLKVEAEIITVNSSVILSTGKSNFTSGNIEFKGESINIKDNSSLDALGEEENDNPGDITLTAKVTDISGFSPVDVFPASDVKIDVKTGAEIKGGVITLTADRTSMLGSPLTVVAVQSKTATINITGAAISGTEVTIEAATADQKPLEDGDMSYFNNYVLGPVLDYGDVLGRVLGAIPVLGPLLQAVSVSIRSAESYVTIDGATITSTGDVTINSTTNVESAASASGGMNLRSGGGAGSTGSQAAGSAPFAVSYSESNAIAITELKGATRITTNTDGTVAVGSNVENTTEAESTTMINSEAGKGTVKTSVGGFSVAVTNSKSVANTIVGAGVEINAIGNANINAVGDLGNTANAGVSIFVDGFGGVGLALGFDKVDIRSEVNGTITAGGEKTVLDLELGGIDTANDTITIPGHNLKTGQELIYMAVDPEDDLDSPLTAIGGLVPGSTYRVVVVDEDTIQLVRGETIDFNATRTLYVNPDSVQSVSRKNFITFEPGEGSTVNVTDNTITFAGGHDFTTGQVVDYLVASDGGEAIGGLENEGTYIVAVVPDGSGNPTNSIKLGTINADDENATAETFQDADGETYYVIDLTAGSATTSTMTF